jgi:hypothetical protein
MPISKGGRFGFESLKTGKREGSHGIYSREFDAIFKTSPPVFGLE